MAKLWNASSSPHLRDGGSTASIMRDVAIALAPSLAFAVWYFGTQALAVIIVCVLSCVVSEAVYQRLCKKSVTVSDGSAAVTGLILAMNLPADAPWWICAMGAVLAIILIKQIFGGIGQNFLNPALGARAILMISWAGIMASTVVGRSIGAGFDVADAVAGATPLARRFAGEAAEATPYGIVHLLIGGIPGMLGETSKITLLLGGAYLIFRRVITWHIPVSFILTAFVLFLISTGKVYEAGNSQTALYQVLSGGLILGAVFMATDYVTSPLLPLGKIIFGVGCGLILWVIRSFNASYPEGCSFALLCMNLVNPLINRAVSRKWFGYVAPIKAKAKEA
ncbi:MAG: RnfABCDGE type electron transport complex subunit D [Oscillospiraceae bacterium]|jgi:electron transport complex protein RnfD|nr:RnfABCDGE type electron transport complex subunit D [Oscillospiraceae bacterium]